MRLLGAGGIDRRVLEETSMWCESGNKWPGFLVFGSSDDTSRIKVREVRGGDMEH